MAIKSKYIKSDMRLNIQVLCKDLSSENEIEETFVYLNKALEMIIECQKDDKIYFFSIEIDCGNKTMLSETFENTQGEFSAWEILCLDFWLSALKVPRLRPLVKNWIVQVEETLQLAESMKRPTESLWEDEYTQLGEPLVSYLALNDIEFVPYYTRLLRKWDLMHEVKQIETIDNIFQKHGVCSETEALLYCRVIENPGQWGIDQLDNVFPLLQDKYGDFTNSLLFRRIITQFHIENLEFRKKNANEQKLSEQGLFNYCKNKEIKDGANRILAELEGPRSFISKLFSK